MNTPSKHTIRVALQVVGDHLPGFLSKQLKQKRPAQAGRFGTTERLLFGRLFGGFFSSLRLGFSSRCRFVFVTLDAQ